MKSKVIDFWEISYREEVSSKPSLRFFNPFFASLSKPHPILTTPGANPYEVNKSVIQLRMLSGRYRDDRLLRHWTPDNDQGTCKLCLTYVGDFEHYLSSCVALNPRRQELFKWWLEFSEDDKYLTDLLNAKINSDSDRFTRFVLDPPSDHDFIELSQAKVIDIEVVFRLTRTFCYSIHRARLTFLSEP